MFRRARMMAVLLTASGVFFLIGGDLQPLTPPQEPGGREKAEAQEEAYPSPRELYEAETIPFSAPPPVGFFTGIKCDLNSNIYLIYTDSTSSFGSEVITAETPLPPIRKVSLDSRSVVSYTIQSPGEYQLVRREDFAVDPRGTVYALLEAYERKPDFRSGKIMIINPDSEKDAAKHRRKPDLPDYVIAKFKEDGTTDSFVKLREPAGEDFEPNSFGVFADGNFLVTGVVLSDRGETLKWFTGIFNRGGVLVQEIKPSGDVPPETTAPVPEAGQPKGDEQASGVAEAGQDKGESGRPESSARRFVPAYSLMVSAPDGNMYLMRASKPARIYAISPIGEVVQEWSVKPPRSDVTPMEMSLAGQNTLLLVFVHPWTREDPKSHLVLALVDLGTGKVTATYQLPEKSRGIPACMTSRNEFLTLGRTEDRKLKVVKFVAR